MTTTTQTFIQIFIILLGGSRLGNEKTSPENKTYFVIHEDNRELRQFIRDIQEMLES